MGRRKVTSFNLGDFGVWNIPDRFTPEQVEARRLLHDLTYIYNCNGLLDYATGESMYDDYGRSARAVIIDSKWNPTQERNAWALKGQKGSRV